MKILTTVLIVLLNIAATARSQPLSLNSTTSSTAQSTTSLVTTVDLTYSSATEDNVASTSTVTSPITSNTVSAASTSASISDTTDNVTSASIPAVSSPITSDTVSAASTSASISGTTEKSTSNETVSVSPTLPLTTKTSPSSTIIAPPSPTTHPVPPLPVTTNTAKIPTPTLSNATNLVPTKTTAEEFMTPTPPTTGSAFTNGSAALTTGSPVSMQTQSLSTKPPTETPKPSTQKPVPPAQQSGLVKVNLPSVTDSQFDEQKFKETIAEYANEYCKKARENCVSESDHIRTANIIIASKGEEDGVLYVEFYAQENPSTAAITTAQMEKLLTEYETAIEQKLGFPLQLPSDGKSSKVVEDWVIAVIAILGFLFVVFLTVAICSVINKRRRKSRSKSCNSWQPEVSLHRNEDNVGKMEMQASDDIHIDDEPRYSHSTFVTKLKEPEYTPLSKNDKDNKAGNANGDASHANGSRKRNSSTAQYPEIVEQEFQKIIDGAEKEENQKLIEEPKPSKSDNTYDNPAVDTKDEDRITDL